jgi:pyruvate ferredoxin oxidoreductase beta subunit
MPKFSANFLREIRFSMLNSIISSVRPLVLSIQCSVLRSDASATAARGRIPVKEFISKQGRFDHLKEEHYAHIQNMVDQMWEEWQIPRVAPLRGIMKARI